MPFGIKLDQGGRTINFDSVYADLIRPAVEAADMCRCEELAGGVIHKPMFERLISLRVCRRRCQCVLRAWHSACSAKEPLLICRRFPIGAKQQTGARHCLRPGFEYSCGTNKIKSLNRNATQT
jgi:hypothetical protein